MNVRAKMHCYEKTATDDEGGATVKLRPVYSDSEENKTWSKYTPSGDVTMSITNPPAAAAFEVGRDYYVDFTPVEG